MHAPEMTPTQAKPRKKRRVFLWFFLAVQLIFLIWIISSASSAGGGSCNGLSAHDCASAHDMGNAIGFGIQVILWVALDFLLGLTYGIYRLARR